jgi:hypothetical protein
LTDHVRDAGFEEECVGRDESEQVLDYPMPGPSALEPPAEWERLGRECPVARVRLPSGDEASPLTRYDDVRAVLSDPRFTRLLNASDAARLTDSESGGVFNSRLPTPELAVPAEELRRVEGLAVGGLRELPVRW